MTEFEIQVIEQLKIMNQSLEEIKQALNQNIDYPKEINISQSKLEDFFRNW